MDERFTEPGTLCRWSSMPNCEIAESLHIDQRGHRSRIYSSGIGSSIRNSSQLKKLEPGSKVTALLSPRSMRNSAYDSQLSFLVTSTDQCEGSGCLSHYN